MTRLARVPGVEKADGIGGRKYHTFLKRRKARLERRRSKADPQCFPCYGRYKGYES